MKTLNGLYSIGIVIAFFAMGGVYVFWLLVVSAMVAMIPFAMSKIFFASPILILLWCFIFGSDPYGSTFAWLCIIYAPFYYISFLNIIVNLAKSIGGLGD